MMSALAASAAQGSELHASTVGANTNITGQQSSSIILNLTAPENAGTGCQQVTFEGTALKTTQATITGTYSGCSCFGLACTVDMNGASTCLQTNWAKSQRP